MKTAVECIPNFSEARNPEIMDHISAEIAKIPQVTLANRHSDLDHNRTVLTLLGNPDSISEAAFLGAKLASELIDLNKHTGQHPRIGALDVLPFVPLENTPMQVCVDIAHNVGKRVGTELGIPVYFYGEAAYSPSRKALENIRRGQYETLRETIKTDPLKKPDEGPAILGNAGAIAIGARKPLIAFNVFLNTSDVAIAKKIARKVRFSSGGYPGVKALGLLVAGQAQVSMNFTDYTTTNLPPVIEAIQLEAVKYGTTITHTELVGLIPRAAVPQAPEEFLLLPEFRPDMVIETYLSS
jgi:glutamate formiminotransferase